jgi:hypothetical protein
MPLGKHTGQSLHKVCAVSLTPIDNIGLVPESAVVSRQIQELVRSDCGRRSIEPVSDGRIKAEK